MVFNSLTFALFILVTFALYYLPALARFQSLTLVVASFLFYATFAPWSVLLLAVSVLVGGFCSYKVHFAFHPKRLLWAVSGVTIYVLILFLFKYERFSVNLLYGDSSQNSNLPFFLTVPLPIGISFYTFTGISLIIDVYRGRTSRTNLNFPIEHFGSHLYRCCIFQTFFPKLTAGPISKAHEFIHQIEPKRLGNVCWERCFKCMVVGYFLKDVVADNLKDSTFWMTFPYFQGLSSLTLSAMLFGYSIQLFADFAGYSLIAIGLASLYGYELPENFNFPYASRSVTEFWRRWHISLSSWFKLYLYIPLGGSRTGNARTYLNLLLVMAICGLWHGAALGYAVWGVWHGAALVFERFLNNAGGPKSPTVWREVKGILSTFAYVTVGWLFFAISDLSQSLNYVRCLISNLGLSHNLPVLFCVVVYSFPVVVYHLVYLIRGRLRGRGLQSYSFIAYGLLIFMTFANGGSEKPFVYFQF